MRAVVIEPSIDVDVDAPHTVMLDLTGLGHLFDELGRRGYEVLGPKVSDGVIDLRPLTDIDDLPSGWTDEQEPGRYRLVRRNDDARFGFAVGPTSAKREFHPPRAPVWTMRRSADGELQVEMHEPEPRSRAFFGLRPCELAAMQVQDRVLGHGDDADSNYQRRRTNTFALVVNCGEPADTCFCSSLQTGPFADVESGADIVMTELVRSDSIRYVLTAGTELGSDVLGAVETAAETTVPTELDHRFAADVRQRAENRITRHLDSSRLRDGLLQQLENTRWSVVGERCLSCGNCTLVCPTCFCSTPEDVTDLAGDVATRTQVWDTCFSATFSQLGDGPVRASIGSRYRQWATHKLASWVDQFGHTGCVGCGRCITWCPVGIDLTQEANQLLAGHPS